MAWNQQVTRTLVSLHFGPVWLP